MNRRALTVIVGLFLVNVAIDLVAGYSYFPGYSASIGLFGCVVIIIVSKWIGATFLNRGEDYYPGERPPDLQPDLLPADHPDATRADRHG